VTERVDAFRGIVVVVLLNTCTWVRVVVVLNDGSGASCWAAAIALILWLIIEIWKKINGITYGRVKICLEVENDCPNKSQRQFSVSINNVVWPDVHQFYLYLSVGLFVYFGTIIDKQNIYGQNSYISSF
jgi:hypothetical protein